jgi:type IV pilus assembly protein PilE
MKKNHYAMSNSHQYSLLSSNAGFTLIELVITVAIVALLVAIAVPSYQESVRKSNRKAAAACLLEQAQFAERFYTTSLTYVGVPAPAGGCVTDLTPRYTFGFVGTPTATAYQLQATAVGPQLDDVKCLNLGINQAGAKTVSGSNSADPNQCWRR